MTGFAFPQPGERRNASAIPVPEPTLAALFALAIAGRHLLRVRDDDFSTPQMRDAFREVSILLPEAGAEAAYHEEARAEAEMQAEYPF